MLEKDLEIKSTNKQRRKLVDYFNQWREEKFGEKGHFTYTMRFDEVHLVSKKMGFIEWLVKENKIDLYKVRHHFCIDLYAIDYGDGDYMCQDYEVAIAVLAIQENPIDFLLSVLK